jgi:hypothetical protein
MHHPLPQIYELRLVDFILGPWLLEYKYHPNMTS